MSELIIEQDSGSNASVPSVTLKNLDTGESVPVPTKVRVKFRLICASKVKKYALDIARANPAPQRAKMFSRVSEDFLIGAEVALKNWIINRVKSQPSKGKTLT